MITIRATTVEDAAQVATCIELVAHERSYLANTEGFSPEQTKSYIEFVNHTGGIHLIVQDEGQIVGWCDIAPNTFEGLTHVGRLGMGLLTKHRGQGKGRQLLTQALTLAFQGGIERIELEVFASNTNAVALYRNAGFVEEGCKRRGRKIDGQYDDILFFGLLQEEWQ